jgi:simple sugar transport system permease protein
MTANSPTQIDGRGGTIRAAIVRRLGGVVRRPEIGAFTSMVLVFVFFAIAGAQGGFGTLAGTASWLDTAAELGILAVPVGLLMIAGEFDLSVGSVLGTSSMVVAVSVTTFGLPLWLAVVLALTFGLVVGFINGVMTTRTGLPSFIVTLVTLFVVSGGSLGLSRLITGSSTLSIYDVGFPHDLFGAQWQWFNISILWWLGVAVVGYWVLNKLAFGNWIFAIGGDSETARLAGVPISKVKIRLFMATATAAALVGVIQALEFNNADASRGTSFIFTSIAAVVIGGVLLGGGYGSVLGIVFGTATYSIVSLGVFYTGWQTDWVQLILGLLLLAAVLGNNLVRRLALTR